MIRSHVLICGGTGCTSSGSQNVQKAFIENIEAFGGNPDNITVMGQSAGAMSTMQHCISPKTHGLFNKAVMSSGGGAHKLMDSAQTYEDRYEFWERVVTEAGCKDLDEFLTVDAEKIFVRDDGDG